MSEDKLRDYLRRVTSDLRKARRDLDEREQRAREPIAIVGMACRYPGGVRSPEDLWELVESGRDAIAGFPENRGWDVESLYDPDPDRAGATYTREGGFVRDADEFDADFFGISPREALAMDPQQRVLLEVCWETLERAGLSPDSLRGSRTGVYIGLMQQDYATRVTGSVPADLEAYLGINSLASVASGRVAYTLGLEGPALTVDTACSSSLVAMHVACGALRAGDCRLALAGGVTILSSPQAFVELSRQRGLSPDGRSKSYADTADGAGWSEGAGMLLLERLSEAQRFGHRVYGLVRGSAVNQDGASNGLTAPSGPSQQDVIEQALVSAGLSSAEVEVVEGHGTGTRLGDPVEVQALLATYGQGRSKEDPLRLGSIKSNIGHSQAAAGVAGVIKMVMAMRRGRLPKTLHVNEPSSQIDWSGGALSLLSEPVDWPRRNSPRRAGISSFGISGTNAHLLLEEAPAPVSTQKLEHAVGPLGSEVAVWMVSARDGAALRAQTQRLEARVNEDVELTASAIGRALAKRAVLRSRAVLVGKTREQLLPALGTLTARDTAGLAIEATAGGAVLGDVVRRAGHVAFVFPGQGAQWSGMALELLDCSPLFAESLDACEAALSKYIDWSLREVLQGTEGAPGLDRIDVVQPTLFAVMVALTDLWRACGVHPTAVIGHSQGEIAAAYAAGGLSLEDAARVVALRSQILTALVDRGAVVSLAAPLPKVEELLEPWHGRLSIGGVNGPNAVAVVGERAELAELLAQCAAAEIRAREIPATVASHSAQVEPLREELRAALSDIAPRSCEVTFYSTVTGGPIDTAELDGEYWYRNTREPVHFEQAVRGLLDDGVDAFVEVSPHPVLTVAIQDTIDAALTKAASENAADGSARRSNVAVLGSLRRGEGGAERLARSLAEAWAHGVDVDWAGALGEAQGAELPELPTYAFQRQRYWLDAARRGEVSSVGMASAEHPLLAAALALADDGWLFTGGLSLDTHPWLSDHAVLGSVVLPGTAFLELALHAGGHAGCELVHELTIESPLVVEEQVEVQLQVTVGASDERGWRPLEIHARSVSTSAEGDTEAPWTRHASGLLGSADAGQEPEFDAAVGERVARLSHAWPPAGATLLASDDLHALLADRGLEYGPAFQGLDAVWQFEGELLAEVSLPSSDSDQEERFGIHPALLDAALHAGWLGEGSRERGSDTVPLPFSWRDVRLHRTAGRALRISLAGAGEDAISLVVGDERGTLVATVGALVTRPVSAERLRGAGGRVENGLLGVRWTPLASLAAPFPGRWAVLDDCDSDVLAALLDVGVGVDRYDSLASLAHAVQGGLPAPDVVLWEPSLQAGAETLAGAVHRSVHEALGVAQAWLSEPALASACLAVLTRGAVAARPGEQVPGLVDSAIWGLVRSAQAENPGRLLLVDLDEEVSCAPLLATAVTAALAGEEPQVAIRNGVAHVPRVARAGTDALSPPEGAPDWFLTIEDTGTLAGLRVVACPEVADPLGPEEIRVAVHVSGVNFRDVMTSLGLVPVRGAWDLIGNEFAGVVMDTGSSVDDLVPGDRVMGLISGGFAPRRITDRRMVVKIPDGWSFTEAASVPVAFLTAYYGLLDLADLRPGERVLVHAAAGGVGMAAVQIARQLGAEVFVTASRPKWEALRAMGCEQSRIASSRDVGFREQFLDSTGGRGVDVVLNSLAGEFVDASLDLLPSGGRFLEMGKTDIRQADLVEAERPGVSYRAFDLNEASPERTQEMLLELLGMFERGALSRLPVRAWDVRQAPEAFRFMSQGRHVGKIVLTQATGMQAEGTVLITGGTGQLGSLLAKHLVTTQGVGNLILTSRRGPQAPGAAELQAELSALGARAQVLECDVSDRAEVERLIASIPDERPLTGVFHAAGVLEDGVFEALSAKQLDRVLAPKVDAAVHLHELTRHLDLRAFVLFSSAAGVFGAPGQANYAAANAFLDALAAHRRAQGLPAASMAWGWWEQASEMTKGMSELDVARMRRSGIGALSAEEGLCLYELACASSDALTVPIRLDMAFLRGQARSGSLPALLRGFIQAPAARTAGGDSGSLARRLADLDERDRTAAVLEIVSAQAAAVLGHASASAIEAARAFKELGFDSLLAVELRNRLSGALEVRLPTTLVFDYPTPQELTAYVLEQMAGRSSRPNPPQRMPVARSDEPVAIIGMSCRYPGGVRSPEQLWELVAQGRDAITSFPADRGWDLERLRFVDRPSPAAGWARQGGFVAGAAEFDAEFFGIGPREALAMDPQQRLLLEICWEAIERAGIDPLSLRGAEMGVFAGISASGYGGHASSSAGLEGYRLTGNVTSVASGRVAYALGLVGPAVSVDTACSSSLVALHLACDALRRDECSMALAGGTMVMSSPDMFVEFSRQGGLAHDGRCKAFSAAADGTGWSEGAGVLLLERLSDALRLGHPVAAVVRGSAINQDGASNGLTAPNGPSQQRVIGQALANAGLRSQEVDAVEAHGTGTTLGDPIEAQALIATYGEGRDSEHPLWVGSIKSNIGHPATAAGVAGVIKMAMALQQGVLPKTLHAEEPSREIDWSSGAVQLLSEATPWPHNGHPRRAGVSSFGISGTNAHVILEQAPHESVSTPPDEAAHTDSVSRSGASSPRDLAPGLHAESSPTGPLPWVISARSEPGLCDQSRELFAHVGRHSDQRILDVGLSLAMRPAFEQRAVVVANGREQLLAGVEALARGEAHTAVTRAPASRGGKVAFMFTGQGVQRVGMARGLHAAFGVFRETLNEVCEQLEGTLERPVRELMLAEPDAALPAAAQDGPNELDRTGLAQPALFAFEVAMFRLVESWGLTPSLLLGHSVGELVAAHVGGVLSLADACALVGARGQLMDALPEGGAMVAVQASEQEALDSLAQAAGRVALAAVNGPASVVLSGDEDAISELTDAWAERGRKTQRLRVSHAFHSPHMDGMLEQFAQAARSLSPSEPRIPIVSNVTGEIAAAELCEPDYWVRHVRETVRFADGVRRCAAAGADYFIELGPDGALSAMARECLPAGEGVVVPLQRAGRAQAETLLTGLAEAWTHGVAVDWQGMLKGQGARRVELPTYAFQRRRYWLDGGPSASGVASLGQRSAEHPLLGAAIGLADGGGRLLTGRISLQSHPWLADHAVLGSVLLPGAALVELALHAGGELGCGSLRELVLETPLQIPAQGGAQLQVCVAEPDEHGCRSVSIHSCLEDSEQPLAETRWTRNATGLLMPHLAGAGPRAEQWMSEAWPPQDAEMVSVEDLYERLSERGFGYGPAFRCVRGAWRRDGELFAEVGLASDQLAQAGSFGLHPLLLDAALHVAGTDLAQADGDLAQADGDLAQADGDLAQADGDLAQMDGDLAQADDEQGVWLPFSWQGVELQAHGAGALRVRLVPQEEGRLSLAIADEHGVPVVSVDSLRLRSVAARQLGVAAPPVAQSLFELDWIEARSAEPSSDPSDVQWVVLGDDPPRGPVPSRVRELVSIAVELLQKWPQEQARSGARLALVTQGALAVGPQDGAPELASAAVWGLARSAQIESPGRFLLVDLDDEQQSWEALPGVLESATALEESQFAIRGGRVLVPRMVQVEERSPSIEEEGSFLGGHGTVLVTGGTSGLGAVLARHLVGAHGVRHLLLASRRGRQAPGVDELEQDLSALGAHVSVAVCDVSDREELRALLASVPVEHPLRAVVHAAGVVEDGLIDSLSAQQVDRVLAPKLDGAWHLHELTAGLGLDAFVMCSSVAGTLGSAGQGNYAAANAFLDGLAEYRRASGQPALSLAWGAWELQDGMTSELGEAGRARIARRGVLPLSSEAGLELFELARSTDRAVVIPVRLDRSALRAHDDQGALHPMLRGVVGRSVRRAASASAGSFAGLLGDASGSQRRRLAVELVRAESASVLGYGSAEAIDAQRPFKELGFDSLAAVELRNRLEALTGLRLDATTVFDYPSPSALADRLLETASGEIRENAPIVSIKKTTDEPIAIVGMSCRYPGGVSSPEDLWRLVADGVDAISPFPEDRGWGVEDLYDPDPDRFGKSYSTEGGFVRDAGDFDCEFFGVGPREALAMDPQQRLLLEASWEAFEDAGLDPTSLRGSSTGVFAGVMYQDYASVIADSTAEGLQGYLGTGSAGSVVSGRVAYTFGLEGPAVSIDTACSSSLVALHWACQALRGGECSLALAAGVTVLWRPGVFVEFSRQRGLAPDGRCKSYADAADGTGWSEGVGVLVLERLSEARRQGHSVLALVRGSAVNQDGASNGLSAPNGPSQQRVIRQALASANLSPEDVDAVEGHGTGTMLGDPIEAQALLASYGRSRPEGRPLWLGSIKSNIGHTQAAAGVAGVIKMVMGMRHGVLPPTLHVDRPSTQVDWSAGAVSLLCEAVPWPQLEQPRRAGVSSFGVSGTNAHVILEQAQAVVASAAESVVLDEGSAAENAVLDEISAAESAVLDERSAGEQDGLASSAQKAGAGLPPNGLLPWVLSARGPSALRAQARRLCDHLEGSVEMDAADVGYSLARRPTLEHRAVLLGSEREGLQDTLEAFARGESSPNLVCSAAGGHDLGPSGAVAFLFTGQGAQRVGMGAELYREVGLYAQAFDEVCAHLDEYMGSSLQDVMFGSEHVPVAKAMANGADAQAIGASMPLDHTAHAQAALFALEVALFRLLEGCIRPDFLIGHSIGELAAAHVAGVLSLADACKLVAARGRLMGEMPTGGAMVAVQASEQEVLASLEDFEGGVALAAVNGPSSVVLSGDEHGVLQLARMWEERGRKTKRLRVSHAFHSPLMDDMLERFGELAADVSFHAPNIPIVSNLTGEPLAAQEICSADYWVRHVRNTVRFGDGIAWLGEQGVRCFVELGPDPVLSAMSQEVLGGDGTGGTPGTTAVALLREGRPEARTLMSSLAEAFVAGAELDWASMLGSGARRVKLPTYAFQRQRYWLPPQSASANVLAVGQVPSSHPLLDAAVELAGDRGGVFTGRLSLQTHPWLADHAAMGAVLLPGTAYVDLALHVGAQLGADVLYELTLEAPLLLEEHSTVLLQVSVGDLDQSGRRAIGIYSRPDEPSASREDNWTRHAGGMLALTADPAAPQLAPMALVDGQWPPRDAEPVELAGVYDRLAEYGLEYGPAFQGVRSAWRRGEEMFAEVSLPEARFVEADAFAIHPALLDAAFHMLIDEGVRSAAEPGPVRLPFSFGGVRLGASGARSLRVRLCRRGPDTLSLLATDDSGAALVRVDSLVAREVSPEQLAGAGGAHHDSLLRSGWATMPVELDMASIGRWALVGEQVDGLSLALTEAGILHDAHQSIGSLIETFAHTEHPPELVLLDCASPVDDDCMVASMHGGASRVLEALQQWLSEERLLASRLVLLTRGAVAPLPEEAVPGLADAALWGLVQSAQAEHPGRFALVDHDGDQRSWNALRGALSCTESRLALRAGEMLVPRLQRIPSAETAERSSQQGGAPSGRVAFDPSTTVLITGGTGGLGALVARHLVSEQGVRHLLLTSRSGPAAPGAGELEAELSELGSEVRIAACDVSVRHQLEQLLGSIDEAHPLGAVVHTAAVMDNGLVDSLTPEQMQRVLAAKADSAWYLHELTAHLSLSAFVLFSSIAGLFGGPGQGNYAAANIFLDRLAERRRAQGLVATAVVWGLWSEAGAGTNMGRMQVRQAVGSSSMAPLSSERGLKLLEEAVAGQAAVVLGAQLDMAVLRAEARAGVLNPLFRGLVHAAARPASAGDGGSLARRLAALAPQERLDRLLELVRSEAAGVLGLPSPNAIGATRAFKEVGFDSLAAVELRNRLGAASGVSLPATLAFDHPNPRMLAEYLLGELEEDVSAGPSVDHALEEIERMTAAVAHNELDRGRLAARLRACLSTLDAGAAEDDLSSASDDEMFEILDTELGAL